MGGKGRGVVFVFLLLAACGDEAFARYTKPREILREWAPWMKIMDALSEFRYGQTGVVDYPIPIIHAAQAYVDADIPHWGYNYWRKMDKEEFVAPFTNCTMESWPGISYGDPFVVYPGKDGPIDSIRWEVFAESLEDYAMLQTIGLDRNPPLLASLKSYADFPKKEEWIHNAMKELLEK